MSHTKSSQLVRVESEYHVTFLGTVTTPEEREELHKARFVHVTGLPVLDDDSEKVKYIIGDSYKIIPYHLGTWYKHHAYHIVTTLGGEMWLTYTNSSTIDILRIQNIMDKFAPLGYQDSFVPLSCYGSVDTQLFLKRFIDPSEGLAPEWEGTCHCGHRIMIRDGHQPVCSTCGTPMIVAEAKPNSNSILCQDTKGHHIICPNCRFKVGDDTVYHGPSDESGDGIQKHTCYLIRGKCKEPGGNFMLKLSKTKNGRLYTVPAYHCSSNF